MQSDGCRRQRRIGRAEPRQVERRLRSRQVQVHQRRDDSGVSRSTRRKRLHYGIPLPVVWYLTPSFGYPFVPWTIRRAGWAYIIYNAYRSYSLSRVLFSIDCWLKIRLKLRRFLHRQKVCFAGKYDGVNCVTSSSELHWKWCVSEQRWRLQTRKRRCELVWIRWRRRRWCQRDF